jgi:HAD superfamily hydrolase (TIGR01490 family)
VFRARGSTDGQTSSIAELALEMAEGVDLADLGPILDAAAEDIASSIRPQMMELLADHRAAGHYCILLSASPQPLVADVAERLDVECGIGTLIEVDDEGVLTGRIEHPMCYGEGKLERLSHVTGWSRVEHGRREESFAYADSMSDLPLLESVGSPVVVTPDRQLRRLADERSWLILDF